MPEQNELTVITKTYELVLWSCHHTSQFPRKHRFVLGERIERNLYDLLETLIQAKYTLSKGKRREAACCAAARSIIARSICAAPTATTTGPSTATTIWACAWRALGTHFNVRIAGIRRRRKSLRSEPFKSRRLSCVGSRFTRDLAK